MNPQVSSVLVYGTSNYEYLSTKGGETLLIQGTNFGTETNSYDGLVTVTYANDDYSLSATDCYVSSNTHDQITCTSAPGAGAGYNFVVTRSGLSSNPSAAFVNYHPPLVTGASGGGLVGGGTEGGETFYLTGAHFGPAWAAAAVSYGPMVNGNAPSKYEAANCAVMSHTKLSCETVVGTGAGHGVIADVAGQLSEPYLANLSYAPPFVA